jgi:hypothetical protein
MIKQTAVEWIHERLTSTWFDKQTSKEILRIAMESEKLQIMQALNDGKEMAVNLVENKSHEIYYEETYGKK